MDRHRQVNLLDTGIRNAAVQRILLLLHTRDIVGSNLGLKTGYWTCLVMLLNTYRIIQGY